VRTAFASSPPDTVNFPVVIIITKTLYSACIALDMSYGLFDSFKRLTKSANEFNDEFAEEALTSLFSRFCTVFEKSGIISLRFLPESVILVRDTDRDI